MIKVVEEVILKPFKRWARLDVKKFVFSNRVVNNWDNLSENYVVCSSICSLKNNSLELELETAMSRNNPQRGLLVFAIKITSMQYSISSK